jgi:hypothetical protein
MDLHSKIRKAWKQLVFRRVQTVLPEGEPVSILHGEKEISVQEYNMLSSDVKERECVMTYKKYSGLVTSHPLLTRKSCCRGCCNDYDHTIAFHSGNYCEIDMLEEDSTFYFNTKLQTFREFSVPPRSQRTVIRPIRLKEPTASSEEIEQGNKILEEAARLYKEAKHLLEKIEDNKIFDKLMTENVTEKMTNEANEIMKKAVACFHTGRSLLKREWRTRMKPTDLAADIICGVVHPRNRDRFQYWFIASEQFFKFYQLIMHDNHPGTYLSKLNKKENVLSGSNRLCTNTYKKKMLSQKRLQAEIDKEKERQTKLTSWIEIMESDDKTYNLTETLETLEAPEYWILRSEQIGREFCHIYPALALMCIYKDKLTKENVPGNQQYWDVPHWMLNFNNDVVSLKLSKLGITI